MDPVNEKRQGLTHFLAHTYSHANIDLAVHTHPHTKMAAILAVMQSHGKRERRFVICLHYCNNVDGEESRERVRVLQ